MENKNMTTKKDNEHPTKFYSDNALAHARKAVADFENFKDVDDMLATRKCSLCENIVDPSELKDDLSRKEFKISGMCQECQDGVFDA